MSRRHRVTLIFGTRPEAIKLAPVVLRLQQEAGLECRVCVTAQHREMLDEVLHAFGIVPDVDLDLMRSDQTLGEFTSRALAALDATLRDERPDLLLIQGDTTTVFCAALAAFYHRIPVGHVEAGLRTGDLEAPWPEEMNRLLTSSLVEMHFAPTESGRANLLSEGIPDERILVTGNTVVDALLLARERVAARPPQIPGLPDDLLAPGSSRPVVLITAHRREHIGPGHERIFTAVGRLAERHPATAFVLPVHRNPRVQEAARRLLTGPGNVHLLEPLSYLPFVALMARARLILTDSGGVQEEAPTLGVPVLILRQSTERPEAVECGAARLVGTEPDAIVAEASRLLEDDDARAAMGQVRHPFGDGRAAHRIVEAVRVRLRGPFQRPRPAAARRKR